MKEIKRKAKRLLATLIGVAGFLHGCESCPAQVVLTEHPVATNVAPVQILTVSNSVITTVFSTNLATRGGEIVKRTVQNTGTHPVLYLINATNVSATNYHGVLAGGTTNRDGLGSIVDFSRVPYPVSFWSEGASTTISVVELTQ